MSLPTPVAREFWFHYRTTVPPAPGPAAVRVWLPDVRPDPRQEVIEHRWEGADFAVVDEPGFGNRILYAELSSDGAERRLAQSYRVRRLAVRLPTPPEAAAEPLPDAIRPYLEADAKVPTGGELVAEASRVASPQEPPVRICRKVFDHLLERFEYDAGGCTLDRAATLGDLGRMCELGAGTCTEWHGLFVAWLRSLGVPARFQFGFNIPRDRDRGTIAGYHCWAEVYLPGVAWFPVDVSEAKKRPDERDRFFGGLDENRVLFTVGRDVRLRPPPAAGPMDKFIFPHAEWQDRPHRVAVEFRFESVAPSPP